MAEYGNPNASFMQQGAYGAQMPQGFGQQPQQFQQYPNYQNFQQFPYGDPSMPMGPPQNFGAPYEFRRRINKMNWDMIGKVDVATIAKTNDVQSIEFLMSPIAFANISVEDNEHFGSQACLHAFMILQLSVEYLLFKLNTTPPPSYFQQQQQQQNQFNQQSQPQNIPNQTITNYEARIDLLNKDIKTRDMLINSLSEKMRQAENERDALRAKLQSMTNQGKEVTDISDEISEIPVKRNPKKRSARDETGLLHPDSDLEEYRENKLKIKSKASKKSSSRKGKKNDESYSYSYSYYDYSESDIVPPPPSSTSSKKKTKGGGKSKPKKKSQASNKKKDTVSTLGLYDDDWPSSSPWN